LADADVSGAFDDDDWLLVAGVTEEPSLVVPLLLLSMLPPEPRPLPRRVEKKESLCVCVCVSGVGRDWLVQCDWLIVWLIA